MTPTPMTVPEAIKIVKSGSYALKSEGWHQIVEALQVLLALAEYKSGVSDCEWMVYSEDDPELYQTSCGHEFNLLGDPLKEQSDIKFCAYCGKKIKEVEMRHGDE